MWLLDLLNGAQWSLHVVIRDAAIAIKDPAFEMMNFFNTFASQVILFFKSLLYCYRIDSSSTPPLSPNMSKTKLETDDQIIDSSMFCLYIMLSDYCIF